MALSVNSNAIFLPPDDILDGLSSRYLFVGIDLAPNETLESGFCVVSRGRQILRTDKLYSDTDIMTALKSLGPLNQLVVCLNLPKNLALGSRFLQEEIKNHPLRLNRPFLKASQPVLPAPLQSAVSQSVNRFTPRALGLYNQLLAGGALPLFVLGYGAKLAYQLQVPFRSRSSQGSKALHGLIKERLGLEGIPTQLPASTVLEAMIGAYTAWLLFESTRNNQTLAWEKTRWQELEEQVKRRYEMAQLKAAHFVDVTLSEEEEAAEETEDTEETEEVEETESSATTAHPLDDEERTIPPAEALNQSSSSSQASSSERSRPPSRKALAPSAIPTLQLALRPLPFGFYLNDWEAWVIEPTGLYSPLPQRKKPAHTREALRLRRTYRRGGSAWHHKEPKKDTAKEALKEMRAQEKDRENDKASFKETEKEKPVLGRTKAFATKKPLPQTPPAFTPAVEPSFQSQPEVSLEASLEPHLEPRPEAKLEGRIQARPRVGRTSYRPSNRRG